MRNLTRKILKSNIGLMCIVLGLGLAVYACALTAPFKTLDDGYSIIHNPDIKDFANIAKIFRSSFFGGGHYYRPLVSFSFMIEYHLFGLNSFYYNLDNLILHLLIVVSLFYLMLAILKDRMAAFFTSLLFVIHPIHWEAVANIPGRAVILSAFFTVNAFLFFIYFLGRKNNRAMIWYILSLVSLAGGLLSKESAAMLPVVLLSYTFFIASRPKRYAPLVPFFILIAGYIFLRSSLGLVETYPWRSLPELTLGFFTFLRGCLTYLRLLIWPAGLHFDRAQAMLLSYHDPDVWATLLVFVIFGFILFKFRKGLSAAVWFFLSWFWIELFPVSQIVTTIGVGPGYISTAEHFLYAPSVGIFVLFILSVQTLYRRRQMFPAFSPDTCLPVRQACRAGLAGIILALMLVTVYQNIHARSALIMFERTLNYNPHNTRILYSMGLEMVGRERYGQAERYFRRALALDPFQMRTRHALGRVLFDQGRLIDSIAEYEIVHRAGAGDALLEKNLNEAYAKAVEQLRAEIARHPDNARLHYSLGTFYSRTQQIEQSLEHYRRAIALDSRQKEALFNLASSYEALGRPEKAAGYYERVLALDGKKDYLDQHAYKHLGEIYERQGDAAKAKEYFTKAEGLIIIKPYDQTIDR